MKDWRKGNSLFDSGVYKTDNWGKNKKQVKKKKENLHFIFIN